MLDDMTERERLLNAITVRMYVVVVVFSVRLQMRRVPWSQMID